MCRENTYAEVPGIYHARKRLCNPAKGQMFQGYEKTDPDDLQEKYKEKLQDEFLVWAEDRKEHRDQLKVLFKRSNRLKFRVGSLLYEQ